MTRVLRAAGGVIIDPNRKGRFLVIHRPKFDDWSFPKGGVRSGETETACALREVFEETGLVCELLEELNPVTYVTRNDNLKPVRYWLMRPVAGAFSVNEEVDAVTWLKRGQALSLLTYGHDHGLLIEAHRRVQDLRKAAKKSARSQDTAGMSVETPVDETLDSAS